MLSMTTEGHPHASITDASGASLIWMTYDAEDEDMYLGLVGLIEAFRDRGLPVETSPEYDEWAELQPD
jgi:hypothetical protein